MALATFEGAVGINAFWPLGGFQAIYDPALGANRPRADPYNGTFLFCDGPPKHHFRPSVLAMVRDAGIDHIRLQYEPTPILWAIKYDDTKFLNDLLNYYDDTIERILRSGLGCMPSAILANYADIMRFEKVFAGLNSEGFELYKEHIRILCRRYRVLDPRAFGMDLLNEPVANGSDVPRLDEPRTYWGTGYTGDWWNGYQPELYALMRAEMPHHTLVATSDGWSHWQTLIQATPSEVMRKDTNLIWTYHPLLPVMSALSGGIYNQYFHISRLNYPPGADGQTLAQAIARMEASVDANPTIGMIGTPEQTKASLRADLANYFNIPLGDDYLIWVYQQVTDWARGLGIAPGNLLPGEIGYTRDSTGFPGNVLGSPLGSIANSKRSRVAAYRGGTVAAIKAGQRRAYDHLDTNDFGFTDEQNNKIGVFDPDILAACQPHSRMLLAA